MIASRYVTFYQSLVNCNKLGVRFFMVPDGEQWRIPLRQELLQLRQVHLVVENLDSKEISDIISFGHPSFSFPHATTYNASLYN
jgi:hypothetical protein